MKTVFATAGLALGASAALLPRQQCCFSLTASGGVSGSLSQLSDGQNRVGLSSSPATYCINNGAITDGSGRGCILTAPTTQFQCDKGATAQSGFSVSSSSQLEYNGSTQFYACPATTTGEYNLYTKPVIGQTKCVSVNLSTGGKCAAAASSSHASSSSATAPAYGSSSKAASSSAASSVISSKASSSAASSASSSTASTPSVATTTAVQTTTVKPATSSSASVCSASTSTVTVTITAPCEQTCTSTYHNSASTPAAPSTPVVYSSQHSSSPAASTYAASSSSPAAKSSSAASSPSAYSSAASSAATTPAASSAPTAATATKASSACQTTLTGAYQTPHLIVPVSSSSPNTAYGTSYNGQINSTTSTIFNFDIPQSYAGKQCSIIFMLPNKSQLTTSDYTLTGSGSISFTQLSSAASQQTSWSNVPKVQSQLNTIAVQPGNTYVVATQSCAAGTTESIEMSSVGGLALNFFEDYNPSALGLYITSC